MQKQNLPFFLKHTHTQCIYIKRNHLTKYGYETHTHVYMKNKYQNDNLIA